MPRDAVPSGPLINSPTVASTSRASENQPLESTDAVHRVPSMIGPSQRRAPLLSSLGYGLQWNPLKSLSNLLPVDYMKGVGSVFYSQVYPSPF